MHIDDFIWLPDTNRAVARSFSRARYGFEGKKTP